MPANPSRRLRRPLLVIGYGNDLRGDDGVGPRAAEAVAAWSLPGVRAIACRQLVPELAEALARCGRVVFVDAAVGPFRSARLRALHPGPSGALAWHGGGPEGLLELSRAAYGRVPPALLLTIPAADLGFGSGLSPLARLGLRRALALLRGLCRAQARRWRRSAPAGRAV